MTVVTVVLLQLPIKSSNVYTTQREPQIAGYYVKENKQQEKLLRICS